MKNLIKKISIVFLLGFVLLLAGCINIEIKQKIDKMGNSNIEIVSDMSKLYESFKEYGSQYGSSDAFQEEDPKKEMERTCEDFNKKTKLKNPKCSFTEDYKITMSGDAFLENDVFTVTKSIPYITYRYDAKYVEKIVSELDEVQGGSSGLEDSDIAPTEQEREQAKMLATATGIKMTYKLEMPGKITKTDLGEVKDNKVAMDLTDLEFEDKVFVESQELNTPWVIGGGVALLLVIIIILVLVMRRK